MTKHTWTSKDVHFDGTYIPFALFIVTSNHELDSKACIWPSDCIANPNEPLSNPSFLTQLNDYQVDDRTEISNSHFPPYASGLSEHVQMVSSGQVLIYEEEVPHACSPILCTYLIRP